MRDDPTSMAPLSQWRNTGLPKDILYQPSVLGGSLGIPLGSRDDFWGDLEAEAKDVTPVQGGSNTRQAINDFQAEAKTTSGQVLQYNAKRTYFAIQNRGAASVFVAFGKPASLESFELPPGPGFLEPILGTVTSVHVISAAGVVPLTILEGFRVD